MDKTTVYLPDELKAAVKRAARQRRSRSAGNPGVHPGGGRRRQAAAARGLYAGSEPIARRVDELLAGFGER